MDRKSKFVRYSKRGRANGARNFSLGIYQWSWPVVKAVFDRMLDSKQYQEDCQKGRSLDYVVGRVVADQFVHMDWKTAQTIISQVSDNPGFGHHDLEFLKQEYPDAMKLIVDGYPSAKQMVFNIARLAVFAEAMTYMKREGHTVFYKNARPPAPT